MQQQVAFHHESLFYRGEDEFLAGTLPFVYEALDADEPVLAAAGIQRIEQLKHALGYEAKRVYFADMRTLGRNPARIIPAWTRFVEQHSTPDRPVRGIGEPIWPGRSPAEVNECHRHESLLNTAFRDGRPWRLLCPYDLDGLGQPVIEAARRSHPFVREKGISRDSADYLNPCRGPGPFEGSLPEPPIRPQELTFTRGELPVLRQFVSAQAQRAPLPSERTEDLVVAINELATNSMCYGGGRGKLRIWRESKSLLCEVSDLGHISEPLAGRKRPRPGQHSGRGLWLVNNLCDLVQVRSAPSGSVVRIHMQIAS